MPTPIFITGTQKYVEFTAGHVLLNGVVLYVNESFRISDEELVGAPGSDFGDYFIYMKPNRRIMESYYTKNWDYSIKSVAPSGSAPPANPDEFLIGRIDKRQDGSGNTTLAATELNRSKRLIDTKDISDDSVTEDKLADAIVTEIDGLGTTTTSLDTRIDALEAQKGRLIDIQTLKGNGQGGLVNISTSGDTIPVRISGANVNMQIVYTPAVDVWWEVTTQIGYIETTTAAYNDAFAQLQISPSELVAGADTEAVNPTHYSLITQRSDVDARALRTHTATWKLAASTTYTAKVVLTFSAGAWRTAVGYNAMYGKAWTR